MRPGCPRTGHQCIAHNGKVYRASAAMRRASITSTVRFLNTTSGSGIRKTAAKGMEGWKLVTDNVWGCEDNPGRDGKSDFMLKIHDDDKIWTFGGDREVACPRGRRTTMSGWRSCQGSDPNYPRR